jgi:hypothetical protein
MELVCVSCDIIRVTGSSWGLLLPPVHTDREAVIIVSRCLLYPGPSWCSEEAAERRDT